MIFQFFAIAPDMLRLILSMSLYALVNRGIEEGGNEDRGYCAV